MSHADSQKRSGGRSREPPRAGTGRRGLSRSLSEPNLEDSPSAMGQLSAWMPCSPENTYRQPGEEQPWRTEGLRKMLSAPSPPDSWSRPRAGKGLSVSEPNLEASRSNMGHLSARVPCSLEHTHWRPGQEQPVCTEARRKMLSALGVSEPTLKLHRDEALEDMEVDGGQSRPLTRTRHRDSMQLTLERSRGRGIDDKGFGSLQHARNPPPSPPDHFAGFKPRGMPEPISREWIGNLDQTCGREPTDDSSFKCSSMLASLEASSYIDYIGDMSLPKVNERTSPAESCRERRVLHTPARSQGQGQGQDKKGICECVVHWSRKRDSAATVIS